MNQSFFPFYMFSVGRKKGHLNQSRSPEDFMVLNLYLQMILHANNFQISSFDLFAELLQSFPASESSFTWIFNRHFKLSMSKTEHTTFPFKMASPPIFSLTIYKIHPVSNQEI